MIIREMIKADEEAKGRLHYQTWQETYKGLMNQSYLDNMKVESCIEIAHKYPQNTLVIDDNGELSGYACYGQCREIENCGELIAIYVLKKYQKRGLGKLLLTECLNKMSQYPKISLWVLDNNQNAINFYKSQGFEFDGTQKEAVLVTPIVEKRMVKVF